MLIIHSRMCEAYQPRHDSGIADGTAVVQPCTGMHPVILGITLSDIQVTFSLLHQVMRNKRSVPRVYYDHYRLV